VTHLPRKELQADFDGTSVAVLDGMLTYSVALGSLLAFVVATAIPAVAGAPTDQIRQRVDDVIKVLDDPALKAKPAERHAAVRKLAEEIFDYSDTARRALGPHWSARTPQERQEFTQLFAEVLDRAYIGKIELYQGEKVRYVGETIDGDEATVKTRIVTKKGSEVPVDYRLHSKEGRWAVYDVVIEGVSLVANYRTQFNKIVQTESYQALVQRLRAKEVEPAASPGRREPSSSR
jgi:phospholipid transport system substrate-binding protein